MHIACVCYFNECIRNTLATQVKTFLVSVMDGPGFLTLTLIEPPTPKVHSKNIYIIMGISISSVL